MLNQGLLQVVAQTWEPVRPQDVFSPTPYTGNATGRTVSVGLDLSGGGSMVWASPRNGTYDQFWSTSGINLSPNTDEANFYGGGYGPIVAAGGFTLYDYAPYNESGVPYMSWTFKSARGFFRTISYNGDGTSNNPITHYFGMEPGLIIIKNISSASNWAAWHRSTPAGKYFQLNSSGASISDATRFSAAPTRDSFTLGSSADVNSASTGHMAYIFAHNPEVIYCGGATVVGGVASVNIGWEPQFLLIKGDMAGAHWNVLDTARGWGTGSPKTIRLNGGGTEYSTDSGATKTSSGFTLSGLADGQYIFVAIRKNI